MPFILYKKNPLSNGTTHYSEAGHYSLAGRWLIQSTLRRLGILQKQDVGWRITDMDLMNTGGYDSSEHALVIDTAPKRPNVSLFEIKTIVGYSYSQWTPIMIKFDLLFVDKDTENPFEMKKSFTDENCDRTEVRTILYLQGGHSQGNWTWGGNTRTTAALLWDDAWNYFLSQNSDSKSGSNQTTEMTETRA